MTQEDIIVEERIKARWLAYSIDNAIYKARWTEIQTVVNGEIKSMWIPTLAEKPDDLICAEKAN
jgi:hypothetical protein